LPLIIAQSDKAATWCRRCSDNTDKNVYAAKTRSDLIDYLRASCRRAEVSLNKYKLTLFIKTSGSSSGIACGSYDSGSSVKKSAYYSFANSCSSSRDKDPFSTKLVCDKWKFDLYDDSLFTTVLNFAFSMESLRSLIIKSVGYPCGISILYLLSKWGIPVFLSAFATEL